ncbi:Uncharacterized protein BP5553_03500 [Venustampulla echinocandica]|uniref:Major facilitator superfamily (MFS) profile domain-containing protein n=1 Tax=Venustampulla echinocandica TaxID=2656787 RepID=A0A370TUH7_9HELO|nr:Uncharacterized protein BP5553_03500 [Venustampulla echinocandica]RDL39160.1 Uncharacterized protein BP5553_03500 [Venustampulla echinocandica]
MSSRILLYVWTISLGGLVIGIDSGIVASVLSQKNFKTFMYPPGTPNTTSLISAIVSMAAVGGAIGNLISGLFLEKLGRKWTLFISTFFTIVGSVLQTAANGVALMIVGRTIAGIALGMLRPTVPVYIAEIAPATQRGRLIGIFGLLISFGYVVAGWVGYSCSFAAGDVTWRLALALQIPAAAILMGLSVFLPESPRWLAQKERYEDMDMSMRNIYSNEDEDFFIRSRFEICEQIRLEAVQRTNRTFGYALIELFNKRNIKRTAVAIMVLQLGCLSGTLVIQQYQSILYASLGFTGQKALLITACYSFMGFTARVGCLALAIALSLLMALSRFYGDGHNEQGAEAGVAFVFIFSALYALFFNSTLHTIPPEYFTVHLRGYGLAVGDFFQGVSNIWLSFVTPHAFDAIQWRYYSVFIACLVALGVFYMVALKETNQMTLESTAALFGDETVHGAKDMMEHTEEAERGIEMGDKDTTK